MEGDKIVKRSHSLIHLLYTTHFHTLDLNRLFFLASNHSNCLKI